MKCSNTGVPTQFCTCMKCQKPAAVTCTGCGEVIDPDVCGCGEPIADGVTHDNHHPIPDGCRCFYDNGDGLGIDRTNL